MLALSRSGAAVHRPAASRGVGREAPLARLMSARYAYGNKTVLVTIYKGSSAGGEVAGVSVAFSFMQRLGSTDRNIT